MIAITDRVNVLGAYRIDDGEFRDRYDRPVGCFAYASLEQAFEQHTAANCVSSYVLNGGAYPWIRFANSSTLELSGLEASVRWLHVELDLPKNSTGEKIWPGVEKRDGNVWIATQQAVDLYERVVEVLVPVGASHYMSRGGIHFVMPVLPEAYSHWFAIASTWLQSYMADVLPRVTKIVPLHVDETCIEPSRLQYLPRICKPQVGWLQLPLQYVDSAPCKMPAPEWLVDDGRAIEIVPLNLKTNEMHELGNFASRWLSSHKNWLDTAMPGTGRNARLYAMGGDIRQFEQAGILQANEVKAWLRVARECGNRAIMRPIHNADAAIENGYKFGNGSDSVAFALRHLEKISQVKTARDAIAAAFKRGRK